MKTYAFMITTALGLALAAGSALAGAKVGGGSDRAGNGIQLNGIPASGFAVETVELPDGAVEGFSSGVGGGSDEF